MIPDSIRHIELFPRSVIQRILRWLDDKQAIVLVGSRQVGKTSILYLLIQYLLTRSPNTKNIFYFDLENFDHLNLLERGPEVLIQSLRLEGSNFNQRIFLFIDEIQYLSHPTNFLKLMVDHHPQIKIICTGSSTLDIRRKFKDSLVGRKVVFEIFSLSFEEFLQFKNQTNLLRVLEQYQLSTLLQEATLPPAPPDIYTHPLKIYFEEYCNYGGYPAVVLETSTEKKLKLLNEIYTAYVRKDLSSLFTIENINAFNQLSQLLALGIGNLLNVNTLTTDLRISRPTLENYLMILENTFIIKRLQPFFRRKKREVIKMPKIFFLDLGLRNLMVKQFGELNLRPDKGALVENFTFLHLYRELPVLNELNFWRTKSGTEVDFVLQTEGSLLPIEVKYKAISQPTLPSGLNSFISAYPVTQATTITKDYYTQIKRNKTRMLFLPVWLLGTMTGIVEKKDSTHF